MTRYNFLNNLVGEDGDKYYDPTLDLLKRRLLQSLVPAFNNNLKLYKKLYRFASSYKVVPLEVNFDKTRDFILNSIYFTGMIREIDDEKDKDLLRNYLAMYSLIYKKNKQLFDLIQELKDILNIVRDDD